MQNYSTRNLYQPVEFANSEILTPKITWVMNLHILFTFLLSFKLSFCLDSFSTLYSQPSSQRCSYLLNNYNGNEIFSYLRFHYCSMQKVPWLSIILLSILAIFMLHILYTTADKYFTESLRGIGKRLKMSSDLIGMTLVPLGNGAPDLFTALARPKIYFLITVSNSIILLLVTFGLGLVVDAQKQRTLSRKKRLDRVPFLRNFAYLLVSCLTLSLTYESYLSSPSNIKQIPYWIPICCLLLYVSYVGFGLVTFFKKSKVPTAPFTNFRADLESRYKTSAPSILDQISSMAKEYFSPHNKFTLTKNILTFPGKLFTALLILPPCYDLHGPESEIQKLRTILNPFLSINFILYVLGYYNIHRNFWLSAAIVICTLGFSFLLGASFQTTNSAPKWPFMHLAWSFTMSIFCMYFASNILMDVFQTISVACMLPLLYLALLTAWGNALGDLISAYLLVHKDQFDVVATTVFANVVQNLLAILAICLLISPIVAGIKEVPGKVLRFSTWFFVASAILIGVAVLVSKFSVRREIGFGLFGLYFVYLICTCLLNHL